MPSRDVRIRQWHLDTINRQRDQVSFLLHGHVLKVCWTRPLTSKHGAGGCHAGHFWQMEDELLLAVQSDKGTEMHAAAFQRLLKPRNSHFFTSENDNIKCAMVECFQRTLRSTSWTFCPPCCTPITLHITVPLAWRSVWWTRPMKNTSGRCTRHDDCGLRQA